MRRHILALLCLIPVLAWAGQPALEPETVKAKAKEIMRAHVTHKEMTPEVARRSLTNFLKQLDPAKVYFVKEEIQEWLEPTPVKLAQVVRNFEQSQFPEYERMFRQMARAIDRRQDLDRWVERQELPEDVNPMEFKDVEWAESIDALQQRLLRTAALRKDVTDKLDEDKRELALGRFKKRQKSIEEDILNPVAEERERFLLANVLKSIASSLDTHTVYFTPQEAEQFMIGVQHRLFGIGAQLRDDLTGFTVVKVIEGGPAFREGSLQQDDRIIAVDGEPVVGMDIVDAVDLIRGEADTQVKLTILRGLSKKKKGSGEEQQLDVTITRGEVVLKDMRVETSYQAYGDGVIGYVKLFSFYEDPLFSSAHDVAQEIQKFKQEHNLKGLILDLRYNSGGLLNQAVAVTGLFISKGVVVSIKDSSGKVQRLRDTNPTAAWDGPVVILVNKASASASEIVAQTLKDYGRAIVVGDEHTFGKGSFQTFTLNAMSGGQINDQGEYKVTRGRYYTVSGKSPQLTGVIADIHVPGALSEAEIGESYAEWPLANDEIEPNFDDDLRDVPAMYRPRIAQLYRFNLQPRLDEYQAYLEVLRRNSASRVENNKPYQKLLKLIREDDDDEDDEEEFQPGEVDLQLTETFNIMRDLIFLRDTSDRGSVIVDTDQF